MFLTLQSCSKLVTHPARLPAELFASIRIVQLLINNFFLISWWDGKFSNLIIHAVHDGHELLQSGLTFLFTTFGHEILTEPGNHAHDLRERTHLHHIGELLVPARGTIV